MTGDRIRKSREDVVRIGASSVQGTGGRVIHPGFGLARSDVLQHVLELWRELAEVVPKASEVADFGSIKGCRVFVSRRGNTFEVVLKSLPAADIEAKAPLVILRRCHFVKS